MRLANLIIVPVCMLSCSLALAQKPVLSNDTVTYKNSTFFAGKDVQILFGSDENRNFTFAFLVGKSRVVKNFTKDDLYPLSSHFSKGKIKIDKVYELKGKFFAKGASISELENNSPHTEIVIDIKGAIDSSEIWEDLN